jgi:hypothetical protein
MTVTNILEGFFGASGAVTVADGLVRMALGLRRTHPPGIFSNAPTYATLDQHGVPAFLLLLARKTVVNIERAFFMPSSFPRTGLIQLVHSHYSIP